MEEKLQKLKDSLLERGSITIALSGGVDSIFLLVFAKEVLGDKVEVLTASAPNFAENEIEYAKEFCKRLGVKHKIVNVDLMDVIRENGKERCYACKRKMFSSLLPFGENLADGTNASDLDDIRPGLRALKQLGIWSPLMDAGITKDEIRQELEKRNIEIYDKPAFACLASRVPYGDEITAEKLGQIYEVEKGLKELGFTQFRARHHGDVVRIELLPWEWDMAIFSDIDSLGKKAGFKYVALDLEGYSTGRMNR